MDDKAREALRIAQQMRSTAQAASRRTPSRASTPASSGGASAAQPRPTRTGQPRDVYTAHRFWVQVGNIDMAAFSECSGLQVETEIFEWEEGGVNEYRHRLPGRLKYSNIVLKRGIADMELWGWYAQQQGGSIQRQNISIRLTGYEGMSEVSWDIVAALPVKWVGPTLKAGSTEVAVETIEFIHRGFQRTK